MIEIRNPKSEIKKMLFVISAPSGAGKTSIVKEILNKDLGLVFSVSATTRKQRANEIDGKDYYFLSQDDFKKKIADNELIEYEEVYGNFYGTLRSVIDDNVNAGKDVIFDIDVNGALSLKKEYRDKAVLIFIMPPSVDTLKQRLSDRKTETPEQLQNRIKRVGHEMDTKDKFDHIVTNDDLPRAVKEVEEIIKKYINN